ncbi:Photolyase/cryptochrome alpha/beta domain-containing protein [Heracleum sosnowskyi]|uniref:Photolyase/cryptochrome alpha/beta domain-containing protein n=1 Tax=Heracleum sosnowskyi TaxID=360622 RepID=A0AAD8MBF6_9APIA|nr:Photolyase/cryptochrome alpha/beta domain-containing protein [Heracleum sosnowskyi]
MTITFLSLSFNNHFLKTPPLLFSSCSAVRSSISVCCSVNYANTQVNVDNEGTAVLWYKQDLRIDDHPGLVSASSHRNLIALYVFDHRVLSRYSEEMFELLVFAVKDLKRSLRNQGSDLMIRIGSAENVIQELVKEVKATHIFAEEEVEYEWARLMETVKGNLAALSVEEGSPNFLTWSTPLYDIKNVGDLPVSHQDFKKLKLPVLSPLLPPKFPDVKMNLFWGTLPTVDDLESFRNEIVNKQKDEFMLIKKTSAEDMLRKPQVLPKNQIEGSLRKSYKQDNRKKPGNSVFVTQGSSVGGGTGDVLNALAAYLRYLEGTVRDDWQEVHEKLRTAETREGASFDALFGSALCLGISSRRRVYFETIKYEKERNAGFLSPFGYSAATVAAAVDSVCSKEWYWLMALRSRVINKGNHDIRFWRWNGYLIQYTVSGCKGPAILLVHGFGAFWEHYRDNIDSIASDNQVWAITLLGFGGSEKPNVVYSELMWAELVRDFIIEVVGEQVHLAGNSLGGYFVAIIAGLWPALVKSVILLNSAGFVIPGYSSAPSPKERRISGPARLGAKVLLLYLRTSIRSIVKKCYPNNPDRADDWLINEMITASYDPGVVRVLESIFSFDLSIPLNYLLEGMENRVLVIQGMNDPISDSKSFLAMLTEQCRGITTKEIDAGHCPHDERPEKVQGNWNRGTVAEETVGDL